MNKDDIKRMLFVLGKAHSLDVILFLHKNGWQTASGVARNINIHIATAVKYLAELHELGLLSRRVKRGRTREAFEYQLKDERISIEFELGALSDKRAMPASKPLVFFAILYTMYMKSRKVVGNTVDIFVSEQFERLENREKNIVMESLMFEGDLEDAKDVFLSNLNGRALTEKRCEEVVCVLSELIESVIAYYESRLGHHSTESLVDVTMEKVIDIMGRDIMGSSGMLNTLPHDYFDKWET